MIRPRNGCLAAAGHFHFDRHFAALNFVRIVLALLDRAFDVHRVQPQQRQDRIARAAPIRPACV